MSEESARRPSAEELQSQAVRKRVIGKLILENSGGRRDDIVLGLEYIGEAMKMGDPEAHVIMAELIHRGVVRPKHREAGEEERRLLAIAANMGDVSARVALNRMCDDKYRGVMAEKRDLPESTQNEGPLRDFDGKVIRIRRRGLCTPIDAELRYQDGKNILTLSLDLLFYPVQEGISDERRYRKAVLDGILDWQGTYQVFGNQMLTVKIEYTEDSRVVDNVTIIPMVPEVQKRFTGFGWKANRERMEKHFEENRAFAASIGLGEKWSVTSRKIIFISDRGAGFQNYEEIRHVAKHEFGHCLGLGDLYCSPGDQLEGVAKGSYPELDGYYLTDKSYNLVMSDHHGVISNNDIEMVVLAFRDNEAQLYQKQKPKDKISRALGEGN